MISPRHDPDMLVRSLRWRRPRLVLALLRWVALAVLAAPLAYWWPAQALSVSFWAMIMATARAWQIHRLNRQLEELE